MKVVSKQSLFQQVSNRLQVEGLGRLATGTVINMTKDQIFNMRKDKLMRLNDLGLSRVPCAAFTSPSLPQNSCYDST
ncbi:hypothetical protein GE061_008666 [Apolygus lucorum]|uniref:Uncharacterized protein n=1 Tax=Apolygus lucorum TaxID=248454 RepID=A0A8S9WJV2_APOLU|nr:hypothetical protein GE061_008666 [Apolygus lucorum]